MTNDQIPNANPEMDPAEHTDDPSRLILMDPESFADFLAHLDAPPRVVPELEEVLRHRAPWAP